LVLEHIYLSFISIAIAIIISVPLGIWLTRHERVAGPVIGLTSIFQTIPSLALLVFLVPFIGTGKSPAIIALTIYGLLPILRNTYLGIKGVDQSAIEAGIGMGMTNRQVLWMVELPLALRVIMGGVRTAAVLIIGVATIAGLIGAGGLGDLIYRGLQTYNTGLILGGAIPAALLAILFDVVLKWMEQDVTPRGLLEPDKKTASRKLKIFRWVGVTVLIIALAGSVVAKSFATGGDKTIVLTGKNFTEQEVIIHILGNLIEAKTDLNVVYKTYLGGTAPAFEGVKNGDYDMYVEYTGTGLLNILKKDMVTDPDRVYDIVKKEFKDKYGLVWLKPLGFNNTYTLTIRKEDAKKWGIQTISDLIPHAGQLTLASEPEFQERKDGLPGLEKAYGIKFGKTKQMDSGIMYDAIKEKEVDVIDAFSTDARIPKFNLQVLEDDKHFFPPYYACPLIREDTLKKYPELKRVLNSLAGKISNEEMQQLNGKVDIEKQDPDAVAKAFLKERGYIQ
jgi:osmoprotectant transport system permease protein